MIPVVLCMSSEIQSRLRGPEWEPHSVGSIQRCSEEHQFISELILDQPTPPASLPAVSHIVLLGVCVEGYGADVSVVNRPSVTSLCRVQRGYVKHRLIQRRIDVSLLIWLPNKRILWLLYFLKKITVISKNVFFYPMNVTLPSLTCPTELTQERWSSYRKLVCMVESVIKDYLRVNRLTPLYRHFIRKYPLNTMLRRLLQRYDVLPLYIWWLVVVLTYNSR